MKVSCPTCFEPFHFTGELAGTIQKCPTCRNEIHTPPPPSRPAEKPVKLAVSTAAAVAPAPAKSRTTAVHAAKASRSEAVRKSIVKPKPRFSYRILGSYLLLSVFLIVSLAFAAGAVWFYFNPTFNHEYLTIARDTIFQFQGIANQQNYTLEKAGIALAFPAVMALLAFLTLKSIIRRNRIQAIFFLIIQVALGFAMGTPFVAIICLMLVSVPGRSEIWL